MVSRRLSLSPSLHWHILIPRLDQFERVRCIQMDLSWSVTVAGADAGRYYSTFFLYSLLRHINVHYADDVLAQLCCVSDGKEATSNVFPSQLEMNGMKVAFLRGEISMWVRRSGKCIRIWTTRQLCLFNCGGNINCTAHVTNNYNLSVESRDCVLEFCAEALERMAAKREWQFECTATHTLTMRCHIPWISIWFPCHAIYNHSVFIHFFLLFRFVSLFIWPEHLYSIFTCNDCACAPRDAPLNNRQTRFESNRGRSDCNGWITYM